MKKIWTKLAGAFFLLQGFFLYPLQVFATDIESDGGALKDTKLVKGTLRLLRDGTAILLIIEAGLCGLLVVKEFIAMQQADEQDKPRHKKQIKTIILSGIIIFCITGLLTAIFSYYQ